MFPFIRPPCPDYLSECWEELGQRYEAKKFSNPGHKFQWTRRFRYDETRQRLSAMTQDHCAFCDGGNLGAMSRSTIEHFRPKSWPEFMRLAWQWENLYPCCDRCQGLKREHFDERLLIADEEGYRFEDYFIVNYSSGEILPNPFSAAERQQRARITAELYGLNVPERMLSRKRELKRYWQREPDEDRLDDFSYRYYLMDA